MTGRVLHRNYSYSPSYLGSIKLYFESEADAENYVRSIT